MIPRKKLIEVALPLAAINEASAREKSIRHGHPSTLHLWWARRPLAAARAVIFAQLVDDPSGWPELFPTDDAQEAERQRLFRLIGELVRWENTGNEALLGQAQAEIRASWRRTCAEHVGDPLFDPSTLPAFHDPFAGGGALPLEAQRLGLEAFASDLNPVAVLINKAMIEIPPKFAGKAPVNPAARERLDHSKGRRGAQGLAEDVRYYGKWMRDEASTRIGWLYPKVEITPDLAEGRPDLKGLVGQKLTVIAWLWARTVKSPNPAFAQVDVPLASTFLLSTKAGKEAYVEPVIEQGGYRFTVRVGKPPEGAASGTKLGRGANFRCVMSEAPISGDYIKAEGKAGRMGARLMAIVAEGERGRIYLAPTKEMEIVAGKAKPTWKPDAEFFQQALGFRIGNYGMTKWSDLFTPRQLVALTTFSDLVQEAHKRVLADGAPPAYADAVATYLAFAVDKGANYWSALCRWHQSAEKLVSTYGLPVLPMTWDYTEASPFSDSSGNWSLGIEQASKMLEALGGGQPGTVLQADAGDQGISAGKVVSTDPPYYANIGYADLSDFFYVWLRRSLKPVFPDLFARMTVPKAEELVATPGRHGGNEKAKTFFLDGMTQAMHRLAEKAHSAFPVTIYYAFQQAESDGADGVTNTGWETFLAAVLNAGFAVCGTWPVRTEQTGGMRESGRNALASSIVLVCRQRPAETPVATRGDFLRALKAELPEALEQLQRANIAPVDLAQAAIGPGMAVFSRHAQVLDASGRPVTVREALAAINQLLDETLAEQEGDFDAGTRWALAWFAQVGFDEGPYGVAETLSKAKNTSVAGLVEAGLLRSKAGKVALLRPAELPEAFDPSRDRHPTAWEAAHQLVRALETGGERAAATLTRQLAARAEPARELAYRLYALCERSKRAPEALAYNALVQSWPELSRLARETPPEPVEPAQTALFGRR
ncbi:MAG: DUF1156 domain-containing protein [Myxococcales bacterium]